MGAGWTGFAGLAAGFAAGAAEEEAEEEAAAGGCEEFSVVTETAGFAVVTVVTGAGFAVVTGEAEEVEGVTGVEDPPRRGRGGHRGGGERGQHGRVEHGSALHVVYELGKTVLEHRVAGVKAAGGVFLPDVGSGMRKTARRTGLLSVTAPTCAHPRNRRPVLRCC